MGRARLELEPDQPEHGHHVATGAGEADRPPVGPLGLEAQLELEPGAGQVLLLQASSRARSNDWRTAASSGSSMATGHSSSIPSLRVGGA